MKIPLMDGRDFRPGRHVAGSRAGERDVRAAVLPDGESPVGQMFAKGEERFTAWSEWCAMRRIASMREPSWPVAYVPSHPSDANGVVHRCGRRRFMVRTRSANPMALASTLRREVPRARGRIPREQHRYAGGPGAGADPAGAAAGDAGAVLCGGGAAAGAASGCMACWIIRCCSGGARSASAWRSARRREISRGG